MYLEAIGRKCMLINLDFANDIIPYEPTIDVRNLISLEVYIYMDGFIVYVVCCMLFDVFLILYAVELFELILLSFYHFIIIESYGRVRFGSKRFSGVLHGVSIGAFGVVSQRN